MSFLASIVGYFTIFFNYFLQNKILVLAISGAFFETSILLIVAGGMCKNFILATEIVILTTIISCLFDLFVVLLCHLSIREKIKKWLFKMPKAEKFFNFVKKRGVLAVCIYRFIPFSRFPVLFSAGLAMDLMSFLIANIIGGIVWCSICIFVGYYGFEHTVKALDFFSFIF